MAEWDGSGRTGPGGMEKLSWGRKEEWVGVGYDWVSGVTLLKNKDDNYDGYFVRSQATKREAERNS